MEKFAFLIIVLTHKFFFVYNTFRAKLWHFGQMKQANEAYVKLFSRFETTCNSIFRMVGLLLVEKFAFLAMVLIREFTFFSV